MFKKHRNLMQVVVVLETSAGIAKHLDRRILDEQWQTGALDEAPSGRIQRAGRTIEDRDGIRSVGGRVPANRNHHVDNSVHRNQIGNRFAVVVHCTQHTFAGRQKQAGRSVNVVDPAGNRLVPGCGHN